MAYPGPGPSSYYAHPHPHAHQQTPPPGAPGGPPPPHHVYGTHSPVPGPRPTYYQYPPPGPPMPQQHHMGSPGPYPPPPLPPQSLPQNARGGHRGNMNGGYNRGGGGAHYYHHHHHHHQQPHYSQPQHYYPQPPPPPPPQQQSQQPPQQPSAQQPYPNHPPHPNHTHGHMVPPPINIHPPQHLPYAPQSATGISSAKYSSYSPSLSSATPTTSYTPSPSTSTYMPSPSAPVFTPSWQTRQALAAAAAGPSGMSPGMASGIGPLPKQLSMPPPVIHMPVSVPDFVPNGTMNGNAFYGPGPGREPEPAFGVTDGGHGAAEQENATAVSVVEVETEKEGTNENQSGSALPPATPTLSSDSSASSAVISPDNSTATTSISLSPSSSDSAPSLSITEPAPQPTITTTTMPSAPQPTLSSFTQIGSISTSSLATSYFPAASLSSSSAGPSSLFTSPSSPQNPSSTLPPSSSPLSSTLTPLPTIPPNTPNPIAQWAIWSKRPQDPKDAPGIIISPRARPPKEVVGAAVDLKMPEESPTIPHVQVVSGRKVGLPLSLGLGVGIGVGVEEEKEKEQTEEEKPTENEEAVKPTEKEREKEKEETGNQTTTTTATTPSQTPATTVPCSPASSHTSISVSVSRSASVSVITKTEEKEVADLVVDPKEEDAISGSVTPVPAPAPIVVSTEKEEMLAAPIPPSTPTPTSSTQVPAAPVPVPTSAAPPKPKSWAALFSKGSDASGSSTSSAPGGAVRNALPTSSVVGFSIPADSALASSAQGKDQSIAGHGGMSAGKRSELLMLLTTGPAPIVPAAVTPSATPGGGINFAAAAAKAKAPASTGPSATASTSSSVNRIKPRGLINSGNMCFANAVLQIMVYCPPFHRLFVELGRVLGTGLGAGVAGPSSSLSPALNGNAVNGVNGTSSKQESATPLVDATIKFLREFIDEKDNTTLANLTGPTPASASANVNVNGIPKNGSGPSGSGSGGYSVARSGKGKEKEQERSSVDEYDWADADAFLPSGIYDAMKTKKRFDSMRGGQQEDAEEFFGFYLDALEEELLAMLHAVNPSRQPKQGAVVEEREEAAPADDAGWLEVGKRNRMVNTRTIKTTESPITRIFGGKFRTTLRTPGQKDSVIVEDWRSLRLDVERPGEKDANANTNTNPGDQGVMTVQEALAAIAHPQQVQVQSGGGGGGHAGEVTAQQQVLIEALPQVLVLHVKRFLYDVKVGGTVKVGKQIRFAPELEIGADIMVPAVKKSHPARYKLFGVLYHHGLSASGGHYTLDVLHPNRYSSGSSPKTREGWVRIDDNLVSDVRMDDVFGAWEKDESRCAYLLFYRRI